MASTNGSGSNAKKAAFEAAYTALKAGKQPSQAEINKIYNQALNQTNKNAGAAVQNTHYSAVDKATEWGNYRSAAKETPASAIPNTHYSVTNNWINRDKNQLATATTPLDDGRTTQQKYDDAKKAYDSYIGSEERKQSQNKVNLQTAIQQLFNVAGGPTSDALMGSRNMPSVPEDAKEKELSATVEHYRKQLQAEEDQRVMAADLKELESWSEEDRNNLVRYIAERDQHAYNALNPTLGTQFDTYNLNPIVEKYGIGKVRQMAESLQRSQNAEMTTKAEEAARDTANERPWLGGTLGSLASVGANLAGAYTGPLGYVVEAGQRTGRYSTLDPNNIGNLPSVYGQTVRSEVAQNIQGEDENTNWLRQLAALGYQGGMSALDSAARIAASGGSAGISAALASSGAFGNGLRQYSQQGASPEQAVAMALTSAGLEYITEKLPTEKVLKMFQKGNTKGAVREVLKQAFLVEPTSEEVNLFAGVAAEALILGDKSSTKQKTGELIANGMSYEEAQTQIYKELWNEALQTYAVSAFSGGIISAGASVIGNAVNSSQQQETPQQAVPAAPVAQQPQNFVEATGEQLAKRMPEPEPPAPLTEDQQHVENAIAELLGVNNEQKNTASDEAVMMQNQEESTSVNTDPDVHTPQEQAVINAYQDSVDKDLVDYVQLVKENPGKKLPRYPLNPVDDRAANDIQRLTGIDVRGNKTEIEPRTIEHILKRHGENGKANSSMRDVNDIGRIQYVIDNYDTMEHGGTTGAYRYQDSDGKQVHAQTVLIKKKVNGTYFVVEAVPDTKKKTLYVLSAYMSKNGQKETASSLVGDAEAYRYTSETKAKSDTVFNNSISESKTEVKGTGAAEQNFSGKAQYQDLLYEGNVQRDRPGDVRPMEVPKTDTYNRNVSEFVGNAYGAAVTPDKMANEIESLVQEGALGFDRRGNQDALNDAAKEIEKRGTSSVRNQITRNIANGKIVDGDIEKAMLLYANLANKNGIRAQESAAEILVDLTTMAHMTGRNLQLFKLLRRMTPEGQLMAINQTVQRNVENMKRKGLVKEDYQAQMDPQLIQEYKKAAKENARAVSQEQKEVSAERMQEIQQAIFAAEAAKMPATFKAKWDAWRYMSMLGNAKTQVRNLVGNLAFMPYKTAKDKMAAIFEKALPKEQRTKAIGTDFGLLTWAKADAKTTDINNALKYSAKIGDDVTSSQFAEDRKVFNSKALDSVRKFVEKVPQAGDMVFKNDYYARSLASFLKARGYNAEAINSGKVSETVLAEARGYAIQETMKATFNDSNAFSDAIASIGRKNTDNVWSKVLNVAAEGILPFRRTPANIAVRFAEYSPAGLAKGVWDMATKVRRGDLSASAAIDQISAGLTGTGVMALGFFLAKGIAGVKITGSGTDEDEKRQGHQDYAVEFSIDGQEYSYKIDWAAPANLPLFVGANIYKAMEEAGTDTDVSTFTSILHSMGTMFDPMLSLSCLSSLNDLVEGIRYAPEGEALYSAAADIATSYFMQGIPALARQTYQATQENKQSTFANSEDKTIRELQKIGAQIPFVGAEFQTDKVNAWGETETTESGWERALNTYFNPGTYKKISDDPVELELNRLNEAQVESVSPPTTDKTVSYTDTTGQKHDDMRLTEEQYQTLATTQGQTAKKLLDKLVKSKDYKVLTDTQKAATVNAVYEYAAEAGKKAALPDYYSNAAGWIKDAVADPMGAVVKRVVEADLSDAMGALTNAWKDKKTDAEAKADLEKAYQVYSDMSKPVQKEIRENASGRLGYFLKAMENGIAADTFTDLYKFYWQTNESNRKAGEKAQQWAFKLERAQENGEITAAQKNMLKDSMTFFQMVPAETEKFDELSTSGLSATDAQSTVRSVNNLIPETGYKQVRDIQKLEAIVQMTLSENDKVSAMKVYMTDSQEEKLDTVLGMGYSAEDYTQIYRIVDAYTSGTGKKARTIEYLQTEYGISYATAKKLYEVFK